MGVAAASKQSIRGPLKDESGSTQGVAIGGAKNGGSSRKSLGGGKVGDLRTRGGSDGGGEGEGDQ